MFVGKSVLSDDGGVGLSHTMSVHSDDVGVGLPHTISAELVGAESLRDPAADVLQGWA